MAEVEQLLRDLEQLKLLVNDTRITLHLHAGVAGASASRLQRSAWLEAALLACLRERAPEAEQGSWQALEGLHVGAALRIHPLAGGALELRTEDSVAVAKTSRKFVPDFIVERAEVAALQVRAADQKQDSRYPNPAVERWLVAVSLLIGRAGARPTSNPSTDGPQEPVRKTSAATKTVASEGGAK